jgi:hypothetical protein
MPQVESVSAGADGACSSRQLLPHMQSIATSGGPNASIAVSAVSAVSALGALGAALAKTNRYRYIRREDPYATDAAVVSSSSVPSRVDVIRSSGTSSRHQGPVAQVGVVNGPCPDSVLRPRLWRRNPKRKKISRWESARGRQAR